MSTHDIFPFVNKKSAFNLANCSKIVFFRLFMLLLLLLLAAIWPKYHSGNWALRYNFIVKTRRYIC